MTDHIANARIHAIPGVGHAAPLTHPEALAKALTEFFTPARQLARPFGVQVVAGSDSWSGSGSVM